MGGIGYRKGFSKNANQVHTWYNNICIFGVMGGLRPTVGQSGNGLLYNSATNNIVIPYGSASDCYAAAVNYMRTNNLLSKNPACSAAAGRKYPIPQCRCCPE